MHRSPNHNANTAESAHSDSNTSIPFSRPFVAGTEFSAIKQAIDTCELSGDGNITRQCHAFLEQTLGVNKALLTTSCTHALEMTALLLRLQPKDEVIVPSFTFVSTANAFALHGAKPVFADIRPDTLNIDESLIEGLITARTRAIVPVHYAGVSCEMDTILAVGAKHRIPVIEDNAHGLFAKYKGRYLGTLGALGTQSFHETKNFTCGEGGVLLINDPQYVDRAEIIREKGTDRSLFYRGVVDKYSWRDIGSSYLPSGILAAFLLAQLSASERIQSARQSVFERYQAALSPWAQQYDIQLPTIPSYCDQAYHMFYMLMPTPAHRTRMLKHLKAARIQGTFHYVPLHSSPKGREFGGYDGMCPVTEDCAARLVRLPFYTAMTEAEQARVIDTVFSFGP